MSIIALVISSTVQVLIKECLKREEEFVKIYKHRYEGTPKRQEVKCEV